MKKTNYSVTSFLAGVSMRFDKVRGDIIEAIETMAGDDIITLSEEIKVSLGDNVAGEATRVSKDKVFATPVGGFDEEELELTDLKTDDLMAVANQMVMDVFPSEEEEIA
jgi:hypothetical protein